MIRFNEKSIECIVSRKHKRKPTVKITSEIEKKIVAMATKNPREDYDTLLNMVFTGTGRVCLQGPNLVNTISHTKTRNILLKHGIRYR